MLYVKTNVEIYFLNQLRQKRKNKCVFYLKTSCITWRCKGGNERNSTVSK